MSDRTYTIGGRVFTAEQLHDLLSSCGGVHPLMLAEAVASTMLDRHPEAQTQIVGEVMGDGSASASDEA